MSTKRLEAIVGWYESLTLQSVDRLAEFYADDARFVDPFNDVQGTAAIAAIFRHMFKKVEAPRFVVERHFENGPDAVLVWRFSFRAQGKLFDIPGTSALRFNADDKVASHRDFWDPASELYAGLPLVGGLFRWLARRFATPLAP